MTSRTLLRGSGFRVGEFRCPPGDVEWGIENWIGERAHVVFPGPAVGIMQAGREPLVATGNETVLYNAGTTYRRRLVSPEGDHSVFVELQPALADEVGPFPRSWAPAAGVVYAVHRLLACRGSGTEPLPVDEYVLTLLDSLRVSVGRPRPSPGGRDARDAVEGVKAVVATRLSERLSLAEIAGVVHYSPYHLARLFREGTGQSICAYRTALRVRRAVDRVLDPSEPLTTIAAELGFASHSHLTTAFGRVLGMRPSDLRRACRLPSVGADAGLRRLSAAVGGAGRQASTT